MAKAKISSDSHFLIDRYQMGFRGRPLFGLNRLVKLTHRKRTGVLYCDNVMCISEAITFSEKNSRTVLYTISHGSPDHRGVYSEPRLNAPNEASEADLRRFHDNGTEVVFHFTPKRGKTFSIESDMYKTFDAGHHYACATLPSFAVIARFELTLDVTAYLRSVVIPISAGPRSANSSAPRQKAVADERSFLPATSLPPQASMERGLWKWTIDDAAGGSFQLIWVCCRQPDTATAVNLEKLITELGVDARLAKDLHNFVTICHYYAAGFRSAEHDRPRNDHPQIRLEPQPRIARTNDRHRTDSPDQGKGIGPNHASRGSGARMVEPVLHAMDSHRAHAIQAEVGASVGAATLQRVAVLAHAAA